jgi:2'-5' RNA ligase
MRLFVAVDIDDETRAQLPPAQAAMQADLEKARVRPRVTWVRDAAAHVTLRFIGETPEDRATAIRNAISHGIALPAFDVRWGHLGRFPPRGTPRALWVGPVLGGEQLVSLATAVDSCLAPLVGPGEQRPFTPHLTLGRVKEPGRGVDWARVLAAAQWRETTTRVGCVVLYVSRPSPKGPTYTALSTGPLSS